MPQPDRIPRTCLSCGHFKRKMTLNKIQSVCWLTGKPAPIRICLSYINARA